MPHADLRFYNLSAKCVLQGISPIIWRRLLVCGDSLIADITSFIPNYGERWRYGESISTAFVESTINQVVSKRMVKKQQMRWSQQGAHLLLQIRTRVLKNKEQKGTGSL